MSRANVAPALTLPVGATVGAYFGMTAPDRIAPQWRLHMCTVASGASFETTVRAPDGGLRRVSHNALYVPTPGNRWKLIGGAAKHTNARGLWWLNANAEPVRVATTLEVAFYNDAIVVAAGWRLATPEGDELPFPFNHEKVWRAPYECCALEAPKPVKPKPVYANDDERSLARAREMLAKATTRVKRALTREKKWLKTVKRLERKLQQ